MVTVNRHYEMHANHLHLDPTKSSRPHTKNAGFEHIGCPTCHLTNIVKALKAELKIIGIIVSRLCVCDRPVGFQHWKSNYWLHSGHLTASEPTATRVKTFLTLQSSPSTSPRQHMVCMDDTDHSTLFHACLETVLSLMAM